VAKFTADHEAGSSPDHASDRGHQTPFTGKAGASRRLIFGISGVAGSLSLLCDWEVLRALNQCALKTEPSPASDLLSEQVRQWLEAANLATPALLSTVELPFESLHITELAMLLL